MSSNDSKTLYSDIFTSDEKLQTMAGKPVKIELKEDMRPFALYAAR